MQATLHAGVTALQWLVSAYALAGRWTQAAGPRWSVLIGCVILAAGLLLTAITISPSRESSATAQDAAS